MTDFEVAMANVMTCDGPELQLVDVLITSKPTKRRPPPAHLLEEMRVAARARRIGR